MGDGKLHFLSLVTNDAQPIIPPDLREKPRRPVNSYVRHMATDITVCHIHQTTGFFHEVNTLLIALQGVAVVSRGPNL